MAIPLLGDYHAASPVSSEEGTHVTSMALLTAEEFAHLPQPEDDSLQELVNGVVVTVPPPSFYHGRVCMEMVLKLGECVGGRSTGSVTCNNSGVILSRNPDTVRGPDLAFW